MQLYILILERLSAGSDSYKLWKESYFDEDARRIVKNYTPPENANFKLERKKILWDDVKKQKLGSMPGFKLTWYFMGMDVDQVAEYSNDSSTKLFVR